ncbi:hypothetical protein [Peptoniphilus harei]|uniref:hypothetical protein n=1 Tax=Peptoniphilus harei TaxID=54005 RepID=UPI0013E06922|nr:hypothetical protein [Peptoniphilus harei]QQE46394.1 hypothetical protein I6H69_05760 [Peptoniphilus harei]
MNFEKIANGKLFDASPVNYKVSIIFNFIKICKVIKLYDFIKNFELPKVCKI